MLQVFDEGQLTDTHGRRAVFTETIIILTTNLGLSFEDPGGGFGFALGGVSRSVQQIDKVKYSKRILEAIHSSLRPELINRLTSIVIFYPLSVETVRKIIEKIMNELLSRLTEKEILLEISESAYHCLLTAGYSLQYGAREMERTINRLIVQPLSKLMLEGHVVEGQVVHVNAENGEIVVE